MKRTFVKRMLAVAMAACMVLAMVAVPASALLTYKLQLTITEALSSVKTSTGQPSKITVSITSGTVGLNDELTPHLFNLLLASFEGDAKANYTSQTSLWRFESDQMGGTIDQGLKAYRDGAESWNSWLDSVSSRTEITSADSDKSDLVELIRMKEPAGQVRALLNSPKELTFTPQNVADGDPAKGNTYTFTMKLLPVTSGGGGGGIGGGGGGSSSGGSSVSPTMQDYTITVSSTSNATVTASAEKAKSGDKVTITVVPAQGYEVDTIIVRRGTSSPLSVIDAGDGKYTFTMPNGAVTIKVAMKAATPSGSEQISAAEKYTDLDPTQWYYTAVNYVLDNHIMTGFSDTSFGPNTKMSRAMVAQIFYNMSGQPASDGVNPFPDVDKSQWYNNAISWAYANGIISGYGDGTYQPDKDISREELVQIFCNFAKKNGYKGEESADLTSYNDYAAMSDWAKAALSWGVGAKLLGGKGGNIMDPQGNAIRVEAAQMIMNFCENIRQ